MKKFLVLAVLILSLLKVSAQIKNPSEKFALPTELSESSGAIFFNGKLVTHNDSGGETKLFELDTISGEVIREITIAGAYNVDWEAITQDETSIYIGDIGNNVSGNRTDLKIYKVSKSDYLSETSVNAETINFSYSNQTDFTAADANKTEWDAEALVSFDANHLILFSKNWVNGNTKAYLIPKTAGNHQISPLATTLDSGGLITGGTFNPLSGKLYLVGYTQLLQPFVWKSEGFNNNDIFSGTNTQTSLFNDLIFEQVEAITFVSENRYLMTSESFSQSYFGYTITDNAKLMAFSTNDTTLSVFATEAENNILIYPNPVTNILHIDSNTIDSVEIFDIKSIKVLHSNTSNIDMSNFAKGIYFAKIYFKDQSFIVKKIIKN